MSNQDAITAKSPRASTLKNIAAEIIPRRIYTVREVANTTPIGITALRMAISAGKIKAKRSGSGYVFTGKSLLDWLEGKGSERS